MNFKIITLLLLLMTTSIVSTTAQTKRINRLKIHIEEAEFFKNVEQSKIECEKLVSRIKQTKGIENDSILRTSYIQTKEAYDIILDIMIIDIDSIKTIGGLVEYFVLSNQRHDEYNRLLKIANKIENTFKEEANDKLKEEKGILKIITDWAVSFLPGWVKKISDTSIDLVKSIILDRFESIRFSEWENI